MPSKQCIDCPPGMLKDHSEFWADRQSRRKDGLASLCKDHAKARRAQWMLAHPGKNSEYCKAAYQRDPAAYVARARAWEQDHPEEVRRVKRTSESARRARKRNQFIEHVDPQIVYEMHGGMCGICEEFIEGDFHVDHIQPLARGGMHGYVNVQPAHPTCNLQKATS